MINENKLLSEISSLKKNMKSENGDYCTGYISSLSTIEGFIAGQDKIGGWILCNDRLPTKEECGDFGKAFNVTVNENGLKTMEMEFVYETVRGKEVCRWKWFGRLSPWEVIAWKPLPEPYNPD